MSQSNDPKSRSTRIEYIDKEVRQVERDEDGNPTTVYLADASNKKVRKLQPVPFEKFYEAGYMDLKRGDIVTITRGVVPPSSD